ncbi:fimbrial biogenesis outer membrane usher protein [Neisseriaceae bacterium TC5R-5]|nr:fimbrial biogenesis outer membrane usher protein [Neisseriaceae bacterium TC5R-5]
MAEASSSSLFISPDLTIIKNDPQTVKFNPSFLSGGNDVDLSNFEKSNPISAGTYDLDIYVNNKFQAHVDIVFVATEINPNYAQPCFTLLQLNDFGIDTVDLNSADDVERCLSLDSRIPYATVIYDFGQQKLMLSIPQAAMKKTIDGYVDPKLWDHGVTAGFLSYSINAFTTRGGEASDTSSSGFLGINAGINTGSWQWRHNSSSSIRTGGDINWQNINTYATYPIADWHAKLLFGESNTSGEFFDSTAYRGVDLSSDDRMLPDSLRGYAPIVRGVANSNAKVEIWQNGFLLRQTTVSPGPFEITDLSATGSSGNLRVLITEANGFQHEFTVPFASVAQLLRPAAIRYSMSAGQVLIRGLDSKPWLTQGTWQRGLNNLLTSYAGLQLSEGYRAGLVGLALNTPVGAFSADITHAKTLLPRRFNTMQGQRLRLSYSKQLLTTSTYIALTGVRHTSSGYLGLSQALVTRAIAYSNVEDANLVPLANIKQQMTLSVNQVLPDHLGSFFISATSNQLADNAGTNFDYQLGYSRSFGPVSMSISSSRTLNSSQRTSTQYFLTFSLPLGAEPGSPLLAVNTSQGGGNNSQQAYLSGSLGQDQALSYGVSYSQNSIGGMSAGLSGQYRNRYATSSVSYSEGRDFRSASVGLLGSVVIHSGGLTLSQQTGDTIALVEAPGASGAKIGGSNNIRINSSGYAVVPYLTPYRFNTIEVDPEGSSDDIEFKSTSQRKVPYAGAIVKMKFETQSGRALLIHAVDEQGIPLRFGAEVVDPQGQIRGVVGQASQLYLRDVADQGRLTVRWGSKPGEQCFIHYQLPAQDKIGRAMQLEAVCVNAAQLAPQT